MSQLTAIELCKVNQIVYHPIWGKGEVIFKGEWSLEVDFKERKCRTVFCDDAYAKNAGFDAGCRLISNLFTSPIKLETK